MVQEVKTCSKLQQKQDRNHNSWIKPVAVKQLGHSSTADNTARARGKELPTICGKELSS